MNEDDRAPAGREEAYAKALELLAARAHFRAELAVKLRRRGFAPETVAAALERLAGHGYLDDLEAARSFARQRAGRQAWGPARLRAELARRRVDEAIVEDVLTETFPDGELEAARVATDRWLAKGGRDRDRLARYLDRRGFSKRTIVEILSRTEPGEPSVHEEL